MRNKMYNKYKLPQGVLDYLPDECYAKSNIERLLLDSFCGYGYKQIETPILERFALFENGVGKVNLNKLFKVSDIDGDLLVLRPDMTMPTSRIVATKLNSGVHKLCYLGKSFCLSEKSMLREFTQVGVEFMGEASVNADIESIALAIQSFRAIGLDDFQIELGHIGFFKGFLSALKLSSEQTDEIIDLVEKKDAIGEELWAKRVGLSSENLQLITRLPMLFGGSEVLLDANRLCVNSEMYDALDNLNKIFEGLKKLGLENYVSFDLSIVGNMKFYSGLVMKGITKYCGRAILSGGRYDTLCDSFGKDIKAVGFAISISYVISALQMQGNLPCDEREEIVIGASKENFSMLDNVAKELENKTTKIIKTFATTAEQLKKEKQNCGASRALFLENGKVEEV